MLHEKATVLVKGTTCTVTSAINGSLYKIKMQNSEYAMKSWISDEKAILNELHALERTGGHPNIVEIVKSDCQSKDKAFNGFLVMEYLSGGTLEDFISTKKKLLDSSNTNSTAYLKDDQVMQMFTSIVSAIAHLHALEPPLYHWDINPSNIMMVQSYDNLPLNDFTIVKLIDFGNSSSFPINPSSLSSLDIDAKSKYFSQSTLLPYRSPEMININIDISGQADVWSLGCLLYSLMYYDTLFKSTSDISACQLSLPSFPKFPPYFEILLSKIILQNPSDRLLTHDLLTNCRDFFIGALPSWITRKYIPQSSSVSHRYTKQPSNPEVLRSTPKPVNTSIPEPVISKEYFNQHILDIAGFQELKVPVKQIHFQFPQEICVTVESVVFTIPINSTSNGAAKHNVKSNLAIYHPIQHILITTLDTVLDIYNVKKKQRIQSQFLPTATIEYLQWLNNNTIAFITKEAVYHMDINNTNGVIEEMAGVFDSVMQYPIQFYDVDHVTDPKWLLLVAPNSSDPSKGQIQLHSMAKSGSQIIPGELARLYNTSTSTSLLLINKGQNHTYMHCVPVEGGDPTSCQLPTTDTVVQCQVNHSNHTAFLSTFKGELMIYNIKEQQCIFHSNTPNKPFIKSFLDNDLFYGIDTTGKLYKWSPTDGQSTIKTPAPTVSSTRVNPKATTLNNAPSTQTVANSSTTINKAELATSFNTFLERVANNEQITVEESVLFCKYGNILGLSQLVISYIEEGRLQLSEQLGDELNMGTSKSQEVALLCYKQSQCHRKVCRIMAKKQDYQRLVNYLRTVEYTPEDDYIMKDIAYSEADLALEYASRHYQTTQEEVLMEKIVYILMDNNTHTEAIGFLQTTLKSDTQQYGPLQTELFKLLFQRDVNEADTVLQSEKYTQYDKWTISTLCIQHQLFSRAISMYLSREQLFKSDTRLSANPVYTELAKYLIKQNSTDNWMHAMNTLVNTLDDQERLGQYTSFEIEKESWFGCVMRSCLENQLLIGVDTVESIYALLEALISTRKKYWLKHCLSALITQKSTFSSNMTLQTMYCMSALLFGDGGEFQPIINKLQHYDHFVVSHSAKVMDHLEDSFRILERFKEYSEASQILVYDINDLARALEFADKVDKQQVWEIVGKGILEAMRQNTKLRLELRKATD